MRTFKDDRGVMHFFKTGEDAADTKQIFFSTSMRGVLRGMHCSPYAKWVTCVTGEMVDIVVNLETGKTERYHMKGSDGQRVHVPAHHAHGFYALQDNTTVLYATAGVYDACTDKTFNALGFDWGDCCCVARSVRSAADAAAPQYVRSNKFLVLGGSTGFLGKWAAHHLRQQGFCVVTSSARLEDPSALRDAVEAEHPDFVICAAGVAGKPNISWCDAHPMETIMANVAGILNVVNVCEKHNVHVTIFGSGGIFCYDEAHTPDGSGQFTESDASNMSSGGGVYVQARVLLEQLLRAIDSKNVLYLRILYPVSSDRDAKGLIGKLLSFKTVHSVPTSVTVIDDLFPLLSKLCTQKAAGILNFVNPGTVRYDHTLLACGVEPLVSSSSSTRAAARLQASRLELLTAQALPSAQDSVNNICYMLIKNGSFKPVHKKTVM